MNNYVTREEYNQLVETVKLLQTQLNSALMLLNVSSNLVAPEQQKAVDNMYMSRLQDEAIRENNERSFH